MTISCPRCKKPLVPPSGAPQAACPHCGQLIQLAVAAPVPFPFPSEPSVAVRSSGSASRRPSSADRIVPILLPILLLNLALTLGCVAMLGLWEFRFQRFTQGLREASDNFSREMKKVERDLKKNLP